MGTDYCSDFGFKQPGDSKRALSLLLEDSSFIGGVGMGNAKVNLVFSCQPLLGYFNHPPDHPVLFLAPYSFPCSHVSFLVKGQHGLLVKQCAEKMRRFSNPAVPRQVI